MQGKLISYAYLEVRILRLLIEILYSFNGVVNEVLRVDFH